MSNSMRFTVLPVGQGTGTMIEVLEEDGFPLEMVLLDLGSRLWRVEETGWPSAEHVVDRLEFMSAPTLEAVFLSHGDLDHYNLIRRVVDRFRRPSEGAPRQQTLEIKKVAYASARGRYGGDLDYIDQWRPVGSGSVLHPFPPHYSDLAAPFYTSPYGPRYFAMCANSVKEEATVEGEAALNKGGTSYLNNLVSLVLAIAYGANPQWIVATGDATGLTMAHCNNALAGPNFIPAGIASITAPHHGSISTTYSVLGAGGGSRVEKDAFAEENVLRFVNRLQPRSLSVSSGEVASYKLPGARTLGDFARYVRSVKNEHFYTAHFPRGELGVAADPWGTSAWPPEEGWYTARTRKAAFTTQYFKYPNLEHVPEGFPADPVRMDRTAQPYNPPPPWAAGWAWEIKESGTVSVSRVFDIHSASPEYLALLEEHGVEMPAGRFLRVPADLPEIPAREEEGPAPARVAAASGPLARTGPAPLGRPRARAIS